MADVSLMLLNFGEQSVPFDLDQSDVVDMADVSLLLLDFDSDCGLPVN